MNASSPWSPWRHQAFRAIWIAGLVSNVGNWMQNVGAAWMMTSLTESIFMVALIQTASSVPSFLLALPAGAAADLVDRRRLMLCAQSVMLLVSIALSAATLTGHMTPWLLLGLTFALGCGNAFSMPAQQATTSDVVPQDEVPRAVVLSGISFNSARAVGPLVAGLLIAWAGSGVVFVANVLSFSVVIGLLWRWKNPRRNSALPRERLLGGVAAGLRYVWHAPAMHSLVLRSTVFVCCSSALWALLPIVARQQLGLGAAGYGFMLGSLGVGSVLGAAIMPWLRGRLGLTKMVALATFAFALASCILGFVPIMPLVCLALVLAGVAWIAINATISGAVHTSVAHWVRGRALAIHLLAFQGAMAGGAIFWGAVATYAGPSAAVALSGIGAVLGLLIMRGRPLVVSDGSDLAVTPGGAHARMVAPGATAASVTGQVVMRICYRAHASSADEFMQALHALGRYRRRNGASRWRATVRRAGRTCGQDGMEEGAVAIVETCAFDSWDEWLRYGERRVLADDRLEAAVQAMHVGGAEPAARMRVIGRRVK
ncbi:MAG: MFS transporter [Burkholderiaceae bacterium]|nr:MFS transporter [Burkholderiaceae bacterium]